MTKRLTALMSASALTMSVFAIQPALADFTMHFGSDNNSSAPQYRAQKQQDVRDARQEGRAEIRDARQDGRQEIWEARQNPYNSPAERRQEVREAKRDMRQDVREEKQERRQDVRAARNPRWPNGRDDTGIVIEFN